MSYKKNIKKDISVSKPIPTKVSTVATAFPAMGYFIGLLVLIVPLMISRVTSDPVIAIRFIALSVCCILFAAYFIWYKKKSFETKLPLLVKLTLAAAIIYGITGAISTFNGINPSAGYFEIAKHFLLFSFLLICIITLLHEPEALLVICKALCLAAIAQSFVGIFSFYDLAFTEIPGANAKPYGLMANRNLFGSAEMLLLPFAIYVCYVGNKLWKAISSISIFMLVFSITISQTRSAWLGTIAIVLLSFLLVMIFIKSNLKKWVLAYTAVTAVAVLLVGLIIFSDKGGELSTSINERIGISKSDSLKSTVSSENTNERIKIWKKTILLIKDQPMLGTGLGNWKLKIPEYGSTGLVWEKGTSVPDRPHNVYLQTTAETGIIGSLFYYGMWIFIVVCGFFAIKKSKDVSSKYLNILMVSGIAALAVDALFSFPTERIEHSMYMFLMAAILLANFIKTFPQVETKKPTPIYAIALLLFSCFGLFIGTKKYQFEENLPIAVGYDKAGKNDAVLAAVEKGNNDFVTVNEEGKTLQVYSSLAYLNTKNYAQALSEAAIALKYNPNSAMVFNNMGAIYANMSKYDSARIYYQKALRIKPKFEEVIKNLAGCFYNLKAYDSCINTLQKLDISGDKYLLQLKQDAILLKGMALKDTSTNKK